MITVLAILYINMMFFFLSRRLALTDSNSSVFDSSADNKVSINQVWDNFTERLSL